MNPDAVRDLIDRLNMLHARLGSWRKVQRQHYPGVAFGTLQRIAGGYYLPKNRRILKALGLLERRKWTEMEKRISRMAKETRKALVLK